MDMRIEPINLPRLRMEELHGFLREVLSVSYGLLTEAEDVSLLDKLSAAVDEYAAALRQDQKSALTPSLQAADAAAEEALRGTRTYIKALRADPDKAAAAVARSMFEQCFFRYEEPSGLSVLEKYGMYAIILRLLEEWPAEERGLLGLDRWVARMRRCYDRYEELREERAYENVDYIVGLSTTTRIAVEGAYRSFVRSINAFVVVHGEERYAELVDTLNLIIGKMKAVIAARRTRAANAGRKEQAGS